MKNNKPSTTEDFSSDLEKILSNHNEALEKEDKRTAFGLQGKESEYICKKYAEEALNSWLKNLLFKLVGIPASLWFCIQIYKFVKEIL